MIKNFISKECFKAKVLQRNNFLKRELLSIEAESIFFNILKNKNELVSDCIGSALFLRDVLRNNYKDELLTLYDVYNAIFGITLSISKNEELAFELADDFLDTFINKFKEEFILIYIKYQKQFMKGNR